VLECVSYFALRDCVQPRIRFCGSVYRYIVCRGHNRHLYGAVCMSELVMNPFLIMRFLKRRRKCLVSGYVNYFSLSLDCMQPRIR